MRDILTVTKFTMKEMIRRKSFIITTIFLVIVIIIGFNVPKIINAFTGSGNIVQGSKFLISDNENLYDGKLSELDGEKFGIDIQLENSTFDEIKEKINKNEIKAGIIIEKQDDENILFRYIVNDTMGVIPDDLYNEMQKLYSSNQISNLGFTDEKIKEVLPEFSVNTEQTEEVKGNSVVIMLISILLFYAIYFCAYQVSSSITTEKTSKIMETLVTSTSPRTIVTGKTIGIGLGGLLQMLVLVVTAVISAKLFLDPTLLELLLSSSQISLIVGIIIFVYFILGYFLYAFLYAVTGSTVSKPEDIQSANTPVMLIVIVGFYIAQSVMNKPVSDLATFANYCPISSPFVMPFRYMMGMAGIHEVLISLAILVVSIAVIAHIATKIYSNAILNYGTKLSIQDLVKMYKTK